MVFYIRNRKGYERYFDTADDAVKYIRRYGKPGGRGYFVFAIGCSGPELFGHYFKDKSGKLIEFNFKY